VLILETPKGWTFASLGVSIENPSLTILPGRGVFASEDVASGSVVEVCPVLIFSPEENEAHIKKTSLYHYT
jgi:hypothetical protein